jgi:subfamily B ATP-binding cassette protein MsbA
MNPFWHFARQLLAFRGTLIWALVFALIASISLGAGLVGLSPILRAFLHGDSLVTVAQDYNAESPRLAIPQAIIDQLPPDPFHGVVLVICALAVLTIFGATANFLHQYFSRTVATKTVARIRSDVFRSVVHMPLSRVIQRGPSQLVARIVRDSVELHGGFVALTSKAVGQTGKGIAAFAFAIIVDPFLTMLAIIIVPIMAVILRKIGKRIRRGNRGALQAQEHLLRISTETLQGLRAVKVNTGELYAQQRFSETNDEVIKQELRVRTARALSSPVMETLSVFVIGALAIFAAHQILSGGLAVDRFLLVLGALAISGSSFRPLPGLINEIQAAAAPAGRLMELLDEPWEEHRTAGLPDLPRHTQSLVFESLYFTYPGADVPALQDVSLEVKHGERIAIVGPNGSGKTTLLSFVPRLLSPDGGTVRIDGTDIASINVRSLRQQVGVVTQETVLFRGTVAENIAFGMPGITREQIEEAGRQAHADEFIRRMPGGYDAAVSEQGYSLSGGQRQRIAIARAILRDPAILILDEATSQIDAESEAHINEALAEFGKGRTCLVIAHRLSTVLNADRIVVMDGGRIVDHGPHDQLLQRCELYARLNRTQLAAPASAV